MTSNRTWAALAAIAAAASANPVGAAHALTYETETNNGARCKMLVNDGESGVYYQHMLYAFKNTAYCQLEMSTDRPIQDFRYAYVHGVAPTQETITLRLCFTSSNSGATVCGSSRTLSAYSTFATLYPPSLPYHASSAFIQMDFPNEPVSIIRNYVGVWAK